MRGPSTGRRILSAAVLLPVLLLSVWSSFARWRCQFDGLARSHCCCPGDDQAAADTPAPATVQAASCCQVERVHVVRSPAEAARLSAGQLVASDAAAASALPVNRLATLAGPWESSRGRAHPATDDAGPPPGRTTLFSLKQSLLV